MKTIILSLFSIFFLTACATTSGSIKIGVETKKELDVFDKMDLENERLLSLKESSIISSCELH